VQLPRADAREQDHHVELAGEKTLCLGVGFYRNFAQGGRDEGIAALFANQFADLGGAAAFECEDAETRKGHGQCPFQHAVGRAILPAAGFSRPSASPE
jgi:hypothetical protein